LTSMSHWHPARKPFLFPFSGSSEALPYCPWHHGLAGPSVHLIYLSMPFGFRKIRSFLFINHVQCVVLKYVYIVEKLNKVS
jgi:hypothetical protein